MGRSLRVLVLNADGFTRRACLEGLQVCGFDVLTARSGAEAAEYLQGPLRIDALVADADLAGDPDGLSVARLARERNPKLDVIYTSAMPHRIPEAKKVRGAPSIRWPFAAQQVAGVIGAIKHRPGAEAGFAEEAA